MPDLDRDEVLELIRVGESLCDLDLAGLDLSGLDLAGADFEGADLEGADLSCSDLSGANFRFANLTRTRFRGAVLRFAEWGDSSRTACDFAGAVWL